MLIRLWKRALRCTVSESQGSSGKPEPRLHLSHQWSAHSLVRDFFLVLQNYEECFFFYVVRMYLSSVSSVLNDYWLSRVQQPTSRNVFKTCWLSKVDFYISQEWWKRLFFLTTNKMFREMFKGRESLSVFCSVTFHRAGIEQLLFISSIFWQGFYIIWQSDPVGDY